MTTKRLSKIFSWMSPNSKDQVDGAAGKEHQVITPSAANNWDNLPTFDKLPKYQDFDGCAWDVWGKDDELGTVNLLTEEVVKKAASEEIKTSYIAQLNTQSGSQWDGLRHFGLMEHGVFYNNVHMDTMTGGVVPLTDPKNIDPAFAKIGIQSGWFLGRRLAVT
ncbi:hypothetical protein VNI00_009792 [Paramarasmius palmivorus]|uniref:Reductive dehalogenase subunit A n=1 Tax=Paramarasmius palmivorus TaxID=297713 RepID=A0AAW0CKU3_9AGAR